MLITRSDDGYFGLMQNHSGLFTLLHEVKFQFELANSCGGPVLETSSTQRQTLCVELTSNPD